MKATLLKEIKDLSKWRDLSCSWIGQLNIVKMSISFKLMSRFIIIPIRFPEDIVFLVEINTLFLTFVWKYTDLE